MTINSEKSKEMLISYAHSRNLGNEVPNILIEGKDQVNLLGITLSNGLTWMRPVDNILKKAVKRSYILYQLKQAGAGL